MRTLRVECPTLHGNRETRPIWHKRAHLSLAVDPGRWLPEARAAVFKQLNDYIKLPRSRWNDGKPLPQCVHKVSEAEQRKL